MSNPLELNEFRFFLNFLSEDANFGLVEITEPIGFDGATFSIKQDSDRYGRDVEYGSVEIDLEFIDVATQPTENTITLPDGTFIDRLTMGLPFLLETYKTKGFESEVEFILKRNNVNFTVGVLDFAQSETDMVTFFKCKVIQETDKALLKRRSEIKVDLLSNEDLDGNEVEPVETHNILLRAKPLRQISKWGSKEESYGDTALGFQNMLMVPLGNNLLEFGIENSYVPFFSKKFLQSYETEDLAEANAEGKILTAVNTLSDITITAKNVFFDGFIGAIGTTRYCRLVARVFVGSSSLENVTYDIPIQSNGIFSFPTSDISFAFNKIEAGQSVGVYLEFGFSGSTLQNVTMNLFDFKCDELLVQTTSTSIDSVIKGIRHIDLIKKTAEKTAGFNAIAPRYDFGGKFYDNFVFNGFLIRQFLEKGEDGITTEILKPIYTTQKDVMEQLVELNEDFQILPNKQLFIGDYKDYYPNRDLGAFLQIPDEDFRVDFNEIYQLQGFNYKYKDFEQDKDESGTIDAVHTQAEFMLPNRQVDNIKIIDVPYTRDPFRIENVRRQNFVSNGSTSTSDDDKFFIIEVEELPENSTNVLSNVLDILITNNPNQMKIISRDNFRWDLLGFKVGDPFVGVTFSVNGVTYGFLDLIVSEIEPTLLTLDKVPGFDFPNEVIGQRTVFVRLEYPLTDVQYVNRTSSGFDIIENVEEPNDFSNLNYTIRRNMRYWESFIRTAGYYNQDKIFKNTYWKSNGELITKLETEIEPIKENESVLISDLDTNVLTPITYTTTVIASFDEVLQVIKDMNTVFEDNTIGGFIRVSLPNDKIIKGYIKSLTYNWGTNVLELELEEKFDSDFVSISRLGDSLIYINETGYDDKIVKPLEYKSNGDYVQLFDARGMPLNNATHYKKYKVQGNQFDNVVSLAKAIDEIW